jgi:glycolate oxidase iron-sulfur subunit
MQTKLADFILGSPQGVEAEKILRACVHCGFCTATCPTYQLLGDELDGPRGRIYQIKQFLEGAPATPELQQHLDRCLTCRSCETTCPSGVAYHRLLDIGRDELEKHQPRPKWQQLQRKAMLWLFIDAQRFAPVLGFARLLRPVLPGKLRNKVIPKAKAIAPPTAQTTRSMLVLEGCVQPAIAPNINQAAKHVLAHLGIELKSISQADCCGALPQHLSAPEKALQLARNNIDAWYPALQQGAEAILITASGCGAQVKDYPHLLQHDTAYADKAAYVADKAKDLVEILEQEDLAQLPLQTSPENTAVHTPCTLQHALGLNGKVEALLTSLGYTLSPVADGHLCCGSAGTYAITQAKIAGELRQRKLNALKTNHPARIVTANIGCLTQLYEDQGTPVMHWINLLESDLLK